MIFSTHIVSSNITITILCFTAARDDEVGSSSDNCNSWNEQIICIQSNHHCASTLTLNFLHTRLNFLLTRHTQNLTGCSTLSKQYANLVVASVHVQCGCTSLVDVYRGSHRPPSSRSCPTSHQNESTPGLDGRQQQLQRESALDSVCQQLPASYRLQSHVVYAAKRTKCYFGKHFNMTNYELLGL